jgi:hypothetical protein
MNVKSQVFRDNRNQLRDQYGKPFIIGAGGSAFSASFDAGSIFIPAPTISTTMIGYQSGVALTTGAYETFYGQGSGATCTTGAGNVCVGAGADVAAASSAYGTAVGYEAVAASRGIAIGAGAVAPAGQVALGGITADTRLTLATSAGSSASKYITVWIDNGSGSLTEYKISLLAAS